jgi:hypothetical protein
MVADETAAQDRGTLDHVPCIRFRNKFNGGMRLGDYVSNLAKTCIQETIKVWLTTENAKDVPKKMKNRLPGDETSTAAAPKGKKRSDCDDIRYICKLLNEVQKQEDVNM